MDHDISHAGLSPEELKAAIGDIFSHLTQGSTKIRVEQACKGGQVLAIKIPTIARAYLDATTINSRFAAYITEHSQAVEDLMNGSDIRDDIRKSLCDWLKRMNAGSKAIPKWRRLVDKHTLPRVERRAAATFFSLCEQLKEKEEQIWGPMRERLGQHAVAEEDEGVCGEDEEHHHCAHDDSDLDDDKPLCSNQLKAMKKKRNVKVAACVRQEVRDQFPSLLAAFESLEEAYELMKPELDKVLDYSGKFKGHQDSQKRMLDLAIGLKAVLDGYTGAKRNLVKQKKLTLRKFNSKRYKSLIAGFEDFLYLLDAIYAHDLMRLEDTVSFMYYGNPDCPHAVPDVDIAHDACIPVISEAKIFQKAIENIAALSQGSEHAPLGEFSSAASEVYQTVRAFLNFREQYRIALHVNGDKRVEDDGPQFEKSWSVMAGYENLLLELLRGYRALLAAHQELQDKAAIRSSPAELGPANIKDSQMILSEVFTYLAGMRGLFSESLFLKLLQCRKSSNYMQNPSEMMLLTPNLFTIWDDCRDKIHTQHSALAKFGLHAIKGGQTENHEQASDETTNFQRFLVSQKSTKEWMTCPSSCAVEYRHQLETLVDALKAYADMYTEDEIAQQVTRYLDEHTKPVTQVMRHFETVVQIAQYEEPVWT